MVGLSTVRRVSARAIGEARSGYPLLPASSRLYGRARFFPLVPQAIEIVGKSRLLASEAKTPNYPMKSMTKEAGDIHLIGGVVNGELSLRSFAYTTPTL